ncbi:aminotransferase class I/II-fold pyridoxal phosphate-dependent enzyme [Sulfurihydrogenibium yellowstonense]
MCKMVPVNEPLIMDRDKQLILQCLETGWISSEGPFIKEFEEKFANYIGKKYGVAVSSGTAALEIAVKALGLPEGSEIIVPTFTIISCVQAIVKAGLNPVLVDCDYRTFNMVPEEIERKITKNTKAIMVVHIYGLPVDMTPILDIARKYNLLIIEDAAEVIGQTYKGKLCGSFGDISVFSFYPNKHITTGEGGMILTDDENLYEKCKGYRNLCFSFDPDRRFIHEEIGWNYRMTNLQAALGITQLERIQEHINKKRWMGKKYNELLSDLQDVCYLPIPKTDYAENIYWVYTIVLKDNYPKNAKQIMKELMDKGIGTRPFFYPMHLQPVFQRMGLFKGDTYPNSEKLYEKGFYIPSGLALTEEQISEVSNALHEVLR